MRVLADPDLIEEYGGKLTFIWTFAVYLALLNSTPMRSIQRMSWPSSETCSCPSSHSLSSEVND